MFHINSNTFAFDPLSEKFIQLLSGQGITSENPSYEVLNKLFVQIRQSLPANYNDFRKLIQSKPPQHGYLCSGISNTHIKDLTFAPDI